MKKIKGLEKAIEGESSDANLGENYTVQRPRLDYYLTNPLRRVVKGVMNFLQDYKHIWTDV